MSSCFLLKSVCVLITVIPSLIKNTNIWRRRPYFYDNFVFWCLWSLITKIKKDLSIWLWWDDFQNILEIHSRLIRMFLSSFLLNNRHCVECIYYILCVHKGSIQTSLTANKNLGLKPSPCEMIRASSRQFGSQGAVRCWAIRHLERAYVS